MRSLLRRLCAVTVVILSLSLLAPANAASTPPTVSGFAISSTSWVGASAPLTVQAAFSAPGSYELTLIDVCTSAVVRSSTGEATKGPNTFSIDAVIPEPLPAGVYQVSLLPKSIDGVSGTLSSTAVTVVTSATALNHAVCANAARVIQATNSDKGLAAAAVAVAKLNLPDATSAVVMPADSSPGFVAVATVFARLRNIPVLFSVKDKLTFSTKQELVRRQATKVLLLSTPNAFEPKVFSTLKALKIKAVTRSAKSAAELAALVYVSTSIKPDSPAVFANFKASTKTLLNAVSFASATGSPLLDVSDASLATTRATIKKLQLKGGIAIGTTKEIPDAVVDSIKKVVRVSSKSERGLALALARSATDPVPAIVVRSTTSSVSSVDFVAFAMPALSLVVDSAGLSLDQRAWLNARGDIQQLFSTTVLESLSDFAFARVAGVVLKRGEPTVIPVLQPVTPGPLTAPATFAFSGSGWGHGIGLSQWGAYAMAKAGKSETEILTHYYTNTTVEAVPDDADVFVGLCVDTDANCYRNANRVSSVKLRLRPTGGSTPTMRLQAADGTSVTITTAHTVTFTYLKSNSLVKTTITGTDAPTLKNSTMVIITWSGSRFSGTLGDEAGIAQVAGPSGDLAAGRTYRFGSMRVRASAAQTDLVAGLSLSNRVRLHDEYLYGIGEVSSSWPAAALKAQVIAARSYVYNDVYNADGTTRPRRSACDCQVYGDIRDQNYVGWSKISSVKGDLWKAAVDATLASETTGLAVKSGNSVVQTFFAAANGGATQNNEDVWGGTGRSYLRSVDDPWTLMPPEAVTVSAWSPRVRTQQVVAAAFNLPNVATLDLSDRFVSGALRSVTATSTTGQQATISGEKFRSSMVSDTGSSLMSTWVWRSIIKPVAVAAPGLSEEFIKHRFFGFCKAPGSTAKKAVLVGGVTAPAIIAAAASYAALTGAALVVVKNSGDANRIKALMTAQAITSVVVVGSVDAAITSALTGLKISWRTISGATLSDTSLRLANDAAAPAANGIVIASTTEPAAWPLAISVSARTGRPLIFASDKALGADVISWISSVSPASIWVVGSTKELPDAALAGFAEVSRVTTTDLPLASLSLLGRSTLPTRGVILMSATSDPIAGVLAALSGMPIVYEDATTTPAVLDWLRRQSLAAAVVDLGVTPEFVQQIRRA